MPKLSNMVGETGTIEIPVPNDDPLIVEYRRGAMTPRRQARMMGVAGADGKPQISGESLAVMCEVAADVIMSWNLTDDNGTVIGTDAESLQDVDMSILTAVMDRVGKAINPDPLNGRDSSNGSSPRAGSEPRQIGMAS